MYLVSQQNRIYYAKFIKVKSEITVYVNLRHAISSL